MFILTIKYIHITYDIVQFFGYCDFNPNFFQSIFLHYFSTRFYQKEIQIQPIGEPWEQLLVEVRQGTFILKFNKSNHRNFSVNLPIVFIYLKKIKSNHQENLDYLARWSSARKVERQILFYIIYFFEFRFPYKLFRN